MKNGKDLAQYLKRKRGEARISQIEVAKQLGYTTPQFISNWERGVSSPPLEKLGEIARIYKIPRRELVEKVSLIFRIRVMSAVYGNKKSRAISGPGTKLESS